MILRDELKQRFGFTQFRPGQEALVEAALAGRDSLGILPTGSGKTLCYQLPAQLLTGLVVVIEPLLALMEDQVARLQSQGEKRVMMLSSLLTPGEFAASLSRLAQTKYLFIAPETLRREDVLAALKQVPVALLVVDEAHCISQWGPDFRPAYLQLGQLRQAIQPRATMALTATAPKRVAKDIQTKLALSVPVQVVTPIDRPNLFLGFEVLSGEQEKQARTQALVEAVAGPTIIYVKTRQGAEKISAWLTSQGHRSAYYHAGLDKLQRELVYRQFMADQLQVVCATSAFGMGVDKPNIRLVIYQHLPESPEAYTQGIGRAGRDGQNSVTAVLVTQADVVTTGQMANTLPDRRLVKQIYANPEAYQNADDAQIDLVLGYIQAQFSEQQASAQLQRRIGERRVSFDQMSALVQAPDCHRQLWLSQFDSTGKPHDDFCCGPVTQAVCNQVPTSALPVATTLGWRGIFQQLFPDSV